MMKVFNIDEIYPLIPQEELLSYSKLFRNELTAALSNQRSSLPTILNPIAKVKPNPGSGVAVSIGGTNGYVSAFNISENGNINFINRHLFSLPAKLSQNELFKIITENIKLVTHGFKQPQPIGLGIAYPLKPILYSNRFLDGELLYMTKGNEIKGLIGKRIGEEYHKFLEEKYGIDTTVAVANDAICLLVGGGNIDIAGVVGTGLNFAYWDKRSAIAPLKLSTLSGFIQNEVAINIESKNFDKIKGTRFREIIDKKSLDPGYSLAEKETAGAYLYKLFNAVSEKYHENAGIILNSTDQLNDILNNAFKYPQNGKGKIKFSKELAERIFQRSAQIVAIQLCGILLKIGKTEGIIPIIMEGSIFWKSKNYPALVNLYINTILPKAIPSFARLFGSSRKGIAILARNNLT